MKLVLAEKPSVAQSIAKVIGATKRSDGYMEGNGYLVSWCVGHLVELAQPESYDSRYSKWSYNDLPIFPDSWQYQVSVATKKQFGILKKLMARNDVESLVCATDAGREGELIFRLVYYQCHCKKPIERLWISSMEDVAIQEGFEHLRPGADYDALYEAALCRERADWLVGINATRLFSTLYGQTLNVGRVMTPTLAMAVMREAAIAAFRPEPFYTVLLDDGRIKFSSERFTRKEDAETVMKRCSGNTAVITKAEKKEKAEKPPALYDLTSLQREANRILGFTAQKGARIMMSEMTYRQVGDYQIPNIELMNTETKPLGKYGRMRRTFLQENNPMLYNDLILSEKLFPHLQEIDETAKRRVSQLMSLYLQSNPAPDKEKNQMAWVQHMNTLKAQAEETVMTELINS